MVSVGSLVLASALPVLQVVLVCGTGAVAKWKGILPAQGSASLAKLTYYIFLPCLIFVSLGASVTGPRLLRWWPIPVNVALNCVMGTALGWMAARLVKTPQHLRLIFTCACGVGNLGNLPLVLVPAILEQTTSFSLQEEGLGIAYVFTGLFAVCVAQFAVVPQVLAPGTRRAPRCGGERAAGSGRCDYRAHPAHGRAPGPGGTDVEMSASCPDAADARPAGGGAEGGVGPGELHGTGVPGNKEAAETGPEASCRAQRVPGAADWIEGLPPSAPAVGALAPEAPTTEEGSVSSTDVLFLSVISADAELYSGGPAPAALGCGDAHAPHRAPTRVREGTGVRDPHSVAAGAGPPLGHRARAGAAAARVGRIASATLLNAPTAATLVGVFVAVIPSLRDLFFAEGGTAARAPDPSDRPPLSVLTDAAALLGGAMIPTLLVTLGAALLRGPGAARVPVATLAAVAVVRLVALPAAGAGVVLGARALGLYNPPDALFDFVLLLQHAMPTALNMHVVASLAGTPADADAVAGLLFWQYMACIFTIPVAVGAFLAVTT